MPIRTILVSLTTPDAARQVMGPAVELARRENVHLVGLHTREAIVVYPGIAMHVSTADFTAFEQSQREQSEQIRQIFEDHTRIEDFVSEWRDVEAQSMTASDRIIEHARAADLVIMPQGDPDHDRPDQHHIQDRTIRKSGRPVLVIPYAGSFQSVGHKVLVGWAPPREAARAAHDAIPLFAQGGEALIVTAHHARAGHALSDETAHELALCYDRHGIRSQVVDRTDDGLSVGSVLQNEAFERGCDLIVTGAFGHSRIYDLVIGATTSELLESMTVPVLFSS